MNIKSQSREKIEKQFDDLFDHWVYLSDIRTGCNWNSFKEGLKSAVKALIDEAKAKKTTKKDVLDWLFDHNREMYYKLLNKDE